MGKQLSERLGIPFYDHDLIEMAAQSCPIDKSFFENPDAKGAGGFWHELGEGMKLDLSMTDKALSLIHICLRHLAMWMPSLCVSEARMWTRSFRL